jgi:hypothetical protein
LGLGEAKARACKSLGANRVLHAGLWAYLSRQRLCPATFSRGEATDTLGCWPIIVFMNDAKAHPGRMAGKHTLKIILSSFTRFVPGGLTHVGKLGLIPGFDQAREAGRVVSWCPYRYVVDNT